MLNYLIDTSDELFFNPMYGSLKIHQKALSSGMHSELHTCGGGKHSLNRASFGCLNDYFYDTIIPHMTRFLGDILVGGRQVDIIQLGSGGMWFEAIGIENFAELHWEVEGGTIIDRQGDNKVKVLFYGDESRHTVAVCGKYLNGIEFNRRLDCDSTLISHSQ